MDKNLFLTIALCLLVYVGWFGFVEKRLSPKPAVSASAAVKAPAAAASMTPAAAAAPSTPAPANAATQAKALTLSSFPLQLGKAQALVSPRGAALVSLKYREPLGVIELVSNPSPGLLASFADLQFSQDKANLGRFTAARADGLKVVKEFVPAANDASLPTLKFSLTNGAKKTLETGAWTLSIGPGLGTINTEEKENEKLTRAVGLKPGTDGLNGKVEQFKPGAHTETYHWLAVDNRYFLAAVLPKPGEFSVASAEPAMLELTAASATLAPGETKVFEVPYYLGEKGHTWLSRYKAGLERSIDFGYFAQLGRWILSALGRLHDFTGNWGWAIILLTIALQIVLFPLTYKSLKAQAAMKRLQPEIARLQQRYAKEPQKLNGEMMELYKKNGANPLGGCLPMLLQMPVFIALFNTLRNAWELHGASWIFWVKDLSAKDPYYVLPLVMGGLMFLQNKLNPPSTDPTQQQMMTWMPIVFTFMFLNFPAGLVLYWLTNSVANFAAQVALKDHFDKK